MSGNDEQISSSKEGWRQTINGLNEELAANDPEALLAANDPDYLLARNDGFEDPGDSSGDSETLKPGPHSPPKSGGIAKQV